MISWQMSGGWGGEFLSGLLEDGICWVAGCVSYSILQKLHFGWFLCDLHL